MSLLLDARKKSQQAYLAEGGASTPSGLGFGQNDHALPPLPPLTPQDNRNQKLSLFSAKSPPRTIANTGLRRNLLALGGPILLLAAGAGYLWHPGSVSNHPQQRATSAMHIATAPRPIPAAESAPLVAKTPAAALLPVASGSNSVPNTRHTAARSAPLALPQTIHLEQQHPDPVDPLLVNAYLAYNNGRLDEAQQLYLDMLDKDAHNADALLGLAAIAQQHGDESRAAQYYSRVLQLDPRNAAANAGMSALTNDEGKESRLKTLLNEQNNAAVLYFALGNLYAEQSRWGEAQQAYFNAYTQEPNNAEYVFNLAVSLDRLGQGKLAAQHYQRALQLDRTHDPEFDHAKIRQHVQALTH